VIGLHNQFRSVADPIGVHHGCNVHVQFRSGLHIYVYRPVYPFIHTDRVLFPSVRSVSIVQNRSVCLYFRAQPTGFLHAVPTGLLSSASHPKFGRFHNHSAVPFPCVTNFYVGVVQLCLTSNSGTGSFFPLFHAYSMLSRPGLSMHFLEPTGLFFSGISMFFNTGRV